MSRGLFSPSGGAALEDIQNDTPAELQRVAMFIQSGLTGLVAALQYWLPFPPEWLLLLAPFMIGLVRTLWPSVSNWIDLRRSGVGRRYATRTIVMEAPPSLYNASSNLNDMMLNAVLVYLNEYLWREHPLTEDELRGLQMRVLLMDPYRSYQSRFYNSPFKPGYDETDADDEQKLKPRTVGRLRVVRAPIGAFAPTRKDGIEVRYDDSEFSVAGYTDPWTRHKLTLRCAKTKDAAAKLDAFVKRALELYAENAPSKEEDDARWFYSYCGEAEGKVFFQQYVLRSNKGFDTLFFPRRDATLTLIDQFVQRRGRFAVEGFPQKLGFLLYGPAGTGRHTFVKALAAYTGRHIVSVPLPKLRTNQQLYDIFFVRDFRAEENGSAQRLRMEDVIFLFDDVDASEPVVCARAARRVVQRRAAARLTAREGDGDGDGGALTNCVIEMDTSSSRPVLRAEESALPLAMLMDLVLGGVAAAGGSGAGAGGDAGSTKEEGAGGASDGGHGKRKKGKRDAGAGGAKGGDAVGPDALGGHLFGMNDMLSGEHKDKLDLAGLLNVLDGVVDAPGRMVVMITEHPEWLDPALIRPGRFSARLRFDYIEMAALVSMLGLYYGDVVHAACGVGDAVAAEEARARAARAVHRELSGAQAAAVRAAVAALEAEAVARGEGCGYRFQVTPCEVEMLCMEQDTLDGFLSQLAALVRGVLTL
ncbi:hypothetical protein ABB37_00092 [Leptomonas pyrrhocoris]|uniref:AAA+ ATPase domain-containing protein n=1 Tax=Leptomonas pyrrhocoris TaxID=157538 RepID=A0A0N0VHN9_LEPPY|nr:hypothetical protein ABB37_00092 [Leptomonas pyrrhocoris]KPA85724.1 hypothetical protein ABB37_00092 [Leptomonas pyrrhocoris]|eukprot:XP_015664163.1 hypothetical protein ABB37_00092 [Leptomonas pyrrhocoris]